MAVDNIDLSGEIKAWKDAAYGKDVRAANVAAFEKIQGTVNDTVQNVNQASEDASSASQNAQKAVDDIQSAIETATSKASEAAGSATAADTSKKAAASSAAAADNSKTQAAASAAETKRIAEGLGGFDGTAAKVKTADTYGLVVSALGESTAQALIDAIANKVMNELINKNKIVNNLLATDASTVLAGTQGAALDKRLVAAEKAVAQLNSDLSFNYLYGYVASDLKLSDYPKDTRNIIPLEASDNSLGNLIELSDDKKWIVFKRNGRVRFNGCLSIYWNNDFYLQVSVCRENDDSKGTPVPVVGVSITCPLKQDNAFVYVDRVLRVKEGERLCFAFIMPNWCDTTGGFINRNSAGTSSGLMANYVSFNDEKYV